MLTPPSRAAYHPIAMRQSAAAFPPYDLLTQRAVHDTETKMVRLERIYHVAQRNAWQGHEVLRALIAKHGPPSVSADKKQAIARIFTIILWGELAAWIVSADLAERLTDVEAKMAATSQAFDEARHFYVMREYLLALGVTLPPLDGYTQAVLRELLAEESLTRKLIGMQLIVENVALGLFREVARAQVEPVLAELMPYYERDEARHVGLGVLYLPKRLAELPKRKLLGIRDLTWGIGDLFGATQVRYAPHYAALGADPRELIRAADKMLYELSQKIGPIPGTDLEFFPTNPTQSASYEDALDLVLPRPGAERRPLGRLLRAAIEYGARVLPV